MERMLLILFSISILCICNNAKNKNSVNDSFEHLYKIIEEKELQFSRVSVTLRLEKEFSKDTLEKIAHEVRNKGRLKYDKVYMFCLLPDIEIGKGAWATTHFDPELEIKILGMTENVKKEIIKETEEISGELLGRWKSNLPYMSGIYTIFRDNGKLKMKVQYQDGSGSTKDLIEKQVKGKSVFKIKGVTSNDYYFINSNKELEIHDNEGLIERMEAL